MKTKPVNLEELRRIRDGTGHSVFGPSSAAMYLNCPGSLIPNLLAPDNAGIDAAYGTVGHGVGETWLKTGRRPDHLVGTNEFVESGNWGFLIDIDEEMLDYVQMYVDWVEFLPGKHFVERRVDFSRLTPIPNQTGTADHIVVDRRRMVVTDLKMGKGVRIYAERNPQAMLYALGALWEFDPDGRITEIEIRIAQPRLDHFDEWVVSRDDLMLFAGWAKARMHMAWQIDAPRVAGPKQCQFCRIAADCTANAKMQVEMTEGVFDNLDQPVGIEGMKEFKDRLDDGLYEFDLEVIDTGTLTTEQLAKLRPFRKTAEKWWHAIDTELMRRTQDGEDLTPFGNKIVEARSIRVFRDTDRVVKHLVELGVPEHLVIKQNVVSPAQAETLLRKVGHRSKDIPSLLDGLTHKPPGKPTIVPLADKRPAIVDMSGLAFESLESETEDEEI